MGGGGDGQTHTIASPNPSLKETAPVPGGTPAEVKSAPAEPAATARQAPMRKSRKRKRRPRTED